MSSSFLCILLYYLPYRFVTVSLFLFVCCRFILFVRLQPFILFIRLLPFILYPLT